MKDNYLLIHKSILPAYYNDVIKAREALIDQNLSISEVCKQYNISRSTYYKYKDLIFKPPFSFGKKMKLVCSTYDEKGILSVLLNEIAQYQGNIISIKQEKPLERIAYIHLELDISDLCIDQSNLIEKLKELKGIRSVELIGVE